MVERDGSSRAVRPLSVFISYRRHDAAYAGRLYDELADRVGENQVFMDVEAIEAGADFVAVILERVPGAGVVLAIVGPDWSAATDVEGRRRLDDPEDFVRRELEAGAKIIPVLVQEARMPAPRDLPESIALFARRQAAILSDRRWRVEVTELIDRLVGPTRAPTLAAAPPVGEGRPTGRRPLPHHRTRNAKLVARGNTRSRSAPWVRPGTRRASRFRPFAASCRALAATSSGSRSCVVTHNGDARATAVDVC